jgi:tetratricopeptide (TPR) repeat protein
MRAKLLATCLALTMFNGFAAAGVLDDCKQESWSPSRIAACTQVINGASFKPEEKVLAYIARGEAQADAGADRQALADFTGAIKIQKDNAAAFAGRGRAKFSLGNLQAAIRDFDQAIRLSPAYGDYYVQRGHVYRVIGQPDPALRDFNEALRLVPGYWSGLNERGLANELKGDLVSAEGNFKAAQDYYDASVADFTAAIAVVPHPVYYANRGYLLEQQGKVDDAIKDFQQAVLIDPSLVDAKRALERLGGKELAPSVTDQRIQQGMVLAEKNCSGCHAMGEVGVSLNKDAPVFRDLFKKHQLYAMRRPVTRAVLAVHQKMPQFNVSAEDVDTIVAYMNSINTGR